MGITAANLGELTFAGDNALIRTISNVPIIFGINNTERMRLTASGLTVTGTINGNTFTTGTGTLTLGSVT